MKILFIFINIFESLLFTVSRPTTIFSSFFAIRHFLYAKFNYITALVYALLVLYSTMCLILVGTHAVTQLLLPLILFDYARKRPFSLTLVKIWFGLIFLSLVLDLFLVSGTSLTFHKQGFMMEANVLAYVAFLFFLLLQNQANSIQKFILSIFHFIVQLLLISTGMFLLGCFMFLFQVIKQTLRKKILPVVLVFSLIYVFQDYAMAVINAEIDKYAYRLGNSTYSLFTVLLSYRTVTMWQLLTEFLGSDAITIAFGSYAQYGNMYIEMDILSQIVKFGMIPGGAFMIYFVSIYLSTLLELRDRETMIILLAFLVMCFVLGHLVNRPVAMFALGSVLGYLRNQTQVVQQTKP